MLWYSAFQTIRLLDIDMADAKPELSANMRRIADGLRSHGSQPMALFCGFDLWLEVMGSGHTSMKNFVKGGKAATGQEDTATTLVVPLTVLGGSMLVTLDPTIPPEEFYFKP